MSTNLILAKPTRADGKTDPISGRRLRLLIIASHVVQYASPLLRRMGQHPRLSPLVAYCCLQGAKPGVDPEFGVEVAWDTPVLEGFPWIEVPNRSPRPGLGRFFGLLNPGLWGLIRRKQFDAILITGYFYASAWIAILSAKWHKVPILITTDGHNLRTWSTRSRWKRWLKRLVVKRIYGFSDAILAGSSGTIAYLESLGFSKDRIVLSGDVVDNDWWLRQAGKTDRLRAREEWKIPLRAPAVLFCGKLQLWKRPLDLLEGFALADVPESCLVFAGDGPLRQAVEERARFLGVHDRVKILGFVNQSQLPSLYCATDLLVLPSVHEAFGFVVNEAMLCGRPVAVSDHVGAKFDLVRDGVTGFVFPTGNVTAISRILRDVLLDPERGKRMGAAARERMETWSPREYLDGVVRAIKLAGRCLD